MESLLALSTHVPRRPQLYTSKPLVMPFSLRGSCMHERVSVSREGQCIAPLPAPTPAPSPPPTYNTQHKRARARTPACMHACLPVGDAVAVQQLLALQVAHHQLACTRAAQACMRAGWGERC